MKKVRERKEKKKRKGKSKKREISTVKRQLNSWKSR